LDIKPLIFIFFEADRQQDPAELQNWCRPTEFDFQFELRRVTPNKQTGHISR
jgi:hypothetical protein